MRGAIGGDWLNREALNCIRPRVESSDGVQAVESITCETLDGLVPTFAVLIPILAAIVAWWLNERSKLNWDRYKRKEERYLGFLQSMPGFYENSQDAEMKGRFISDLRLAWLYCPDKVVRAGNEFLTAVTTGSEATEGEVQIKLAEFELELRRDLLERTNLTAEDRKNWRSN